jgi:hypothetical protein
VGAAELLDNDQRGPLLSQSSDESLLRKRKDLNLSFLSDDDDVDNYDSSDEDKQSYRTPVSERLKLESMSVFYSKHIFPVSLGRVQDEYD